MSIPVTALCSACLSGFTADGSECLGCGGTGEVEVSEAEITAVMEAAGREGSGEADGLVDALRCAAPPLPRSP